MFMTSIGFLVFISWPQFGDGNLQHDVGTRLSTPWKNELKIMGEWKVFITIQKTEVNLSASLTYKKYSQTTKFRWPFDLKELTAMRKSLGNHPFLVACLSFWERKLLHFLQIQPVWYGHFPWPPSVSVFLTVIGVLIYRQHWERQLCTEQSWTLDILQSWLGMSAVLNTVKQSSDVMSNARFEIVGLGS